MHDNNISRSEVPSNVSQDALNDRARVESIADMFCDADGMPYELTTHYLLYGPALPSELDQARHRAYSRDQARAHVIIDYQLI